METLNITAKHESTGDWTIQEVQGERIEIKGVKCFAHVDVENTDHGPVEWHVVSCVQTGGMISHGLSKDLAISQAEITLTRFDYDFAMNKYKKTVKGIKFPVNN